MISVIIPSKDRCNYLKKNLPSFLQQQEVGEVIVVVDGSTDGSQDYLESFSKHNKKMRYLVNNVNRGVPYTKNRGIEVAKEEYIFVAEDDLELTPHFFSTLLKHMKLLDVDIICGRNIFRYDYESAEEAIERTNKLSGPYVNERIIEIETSMNIGQDMVTKMTAAPVLGKSEIFRRIKFDERYKVNFWREETDFQISAQEAGYKLGSCPHAICYNYIITADKGGVHASGRLKTAKWTVKNNKMFLSKHYDFISKNMDINPRTYIWSFAIRRYAAAIIIATLGPIKRILIKLTNVLNFRK
jgi:glycosyltransferase involved in cell wall biosynthesis